MRTNASLANLSERQLLSRFGDLVRQDRRHNAQLLAAIAEIDQRKLWAKHGCPSMFAFCVERFHMSESITAKRIWAARTARRFPVVFEMVARGELHLSAIVQLAKHLSEDNHRAVLARAPNNPRVFAARQLAAPLVAELAPRPDALSRIRALPNRAGCIGRSEPELTDARTPAGREQGVAAGVRTPRGAEQAATTCLPCASNAPRAPRPRKQVVALAPRRYKIEITVDQQTHDKLRMLEDLLGHQLPGADPAIIISRAIDRLLTETLKKKAALTGRARPSARSARHGARPIGQAKARPATRRTRAIPAAIRREVWQRDSGRCTFIDPQGRRCRATRCIEYHHDRPYGKGGQHDASNLALRCRAHNQYQADLDFGKEFMRSKRSRNTDSPHSARNV